ncbi:hypothetical protein Ancab_021960 [Ancistrocladus abbreviatus]
MMERNSTMHHAKTYAEAVTQPQRSEKQQNNISENRNRASPTTEGKEDMESEIENENTDWLTGCYVGQTYEIEQNWSNKDHEEHTRVGTKDVTVQPGVEAPSPYNHTTTPANSLPSSADHQSKGSRSNQISSRWAPRAESDGPNLEICALHKSPDSGRYVGNETRAEERNQGEKNGGALIDGQQREEGDLHGGQRTKNEWETTISLLRREKGRRKKSKRIPILHTVGSVEVPNTGREKEGDRQQPITK